MLFQKLHLPLTEHKTAGPGTVIEYLGILLDTINMEARLPSNKLERITQLVTQFSTKKTCTKRELLSLLGHLHYASRIVLPGRSFVSSFIQLSTTVSELHYHVSFNKQCRADLQMWSAFLRQWNRISMFYDDHVTAAPDIHLFSDASSVHGPAAYFQGHWYQSHWDDLILQKLVPKEELSMAYMELYPIVAAAVLWGSAWAGKRIELHCDNQATVHLISKGRCKCSVIMPLMRKLKYLSAKLSFIIVATYIESRANGIADALSRFDNVRFRQLAPLADPHPCKCPEPWELTWP